MVNLFLGKRPSLRHKSFALLVVRIRRLPNRRQPRRERSGHRLRVVLEDDDVRDRNQHRRGELDERAFKQPWTSRITVGHKMRQSFQPAAAMTLSLLSSARR